MHFNIIIIIFYYSQSKMMWKAGMQTEKLIIAAKEVSNLAKER